MSPVQRKKNLMRKKVLHITNITQCDVLYTTNCIPLVTISITGCNLFMVVQWNLSIPNTTCPSVLISGVSSFQGFVFVFVPTLGHVQVS